MIGKFINSRLSGYVAIGGIVVILALVFYIYNEGKKSCQNSINKGQVENAIEVGRETQEVKKQEQRLKIPQLDKGLCKLGIVRGDAGCE